MQSQQRVLATAIAASLGLIALAHGARQSPSIERLAAQQAVVCAWRELAVQIPPRYHGAAVFDSVDRRIYYYGGLDVGGSASASVIGVDVSDPDIERAHVVPLPIEGQQPVPRWGHSGVFRPTDGDPVVYWIAGQSGGRFEPTPTPMTPMPQRTVTPSPRPT